MTSYLGHDKQEAFFHQAFVRGSLHHAWILAGDRGLGKAGFAKQAAQFLLDSQNDPESFAGNDHSEAAKLLAAQSHPDFRLLRRGPKGDKEERKARDNGLNSLEEHELARNIKIAQVRDLQSLFDTHASIAQYRVVMIDAIDDLERSGANALLKNLEEPPNNTVFLLVSHAPERLLPTIRSRCQILRFDPLTDEQMKSVLTKQNPNLKDADLAALVAAGEGSPGKTLRYIDVDLAELEVVAAKIMQSGDPHNKLKSELARKLALKAAMPRYRAFLDRAPSLMAHHIKSMDKKQHMPAIESWREASELAEMAIPKALDNQAVVFRLGSLMGSLAQTNAQS